MTPGKRRHGLSSLKNAFRTIVILSLSSRHDSNRVHPEQNAIPCPAFNARRFTSHKQGLPSVCFDSQLYRRLSGLMGRSSKQDASQDGASANYCASLALVASVMSKDRCCPTLVFSLIPTASTQPLLIFCAVIAPFLPTFVMDSYCAWYEGCPRWKILNRITF